MQCRAQSAGTLYTPHLATQPHGSRASLYSSPRPTLDGQVARDEDDRDLGDRAQRAGRELDGQRDHALRFRGARESRTHPRIEEIGAHAIVRTV